MNYIGSKHSLIEFLEESINKIVGNRKGVFCDLFAGTGAVGTHFKKKGYKVIANDIQYYSYVLNRHYVGNHKELLFDRLSDDVPDLEKTTIKSKAGIVCEYLNDLEGVDGFIYSNYCPGGTKGEERRMYFSDENGRRADVIRKTIEKWKEEKSVSDDEYYFLLASLIESIDKYANTASVYGAFLKKIKKSAQRSMVFEPAKHFINNNEHEVFNEDINDLIGRIEGDILYLDPPYNQRQYASNYHVLETIAKYDNPEVRGKTGLRDYSEQKSAYCSRSQVKEAFSDLINKAKVKYIFLSYNNEGLMTPEDVREIMSDRGEYGFFTKEYNRFKADKSENRNYKANKTKEYLHYVVCK